MAFTILDMGTFIQPATAVSQYIPVPSSADYFVTTNLTQMTVDPAPATPVVVRAEWFGGGLTADNDGLRWRKGVSLNSIFIDKFSNTTASNGFTYYTKYPEPQAALTGTTITNASPAVATVTNTYSEGDQVVIYGSTGALMYSGMEFTISSVSGSGFTLLGLNTPGSAASAFQVRRVSPWPRVKPPFLYVTAITKAASAQVTVSQADMVYVGQKLEFTIPGSFGMVQLNNFNLPQSKPVVVTKIVDSYNFLIDVNTTGFTTFAFPLTASSPTAQLFATVAPAGQSTQVNVVTGVQTGYDFQHLAFQSGGFTPTMLLPAGAQSPGGAAGDTIVWQAYKSERGIVNAPVPS